MNPYCDCGHMTRQHDDDGMGRCLIVLCDCTQFHNQSVKIDETPVETDPLVLKTKYELGLLHMTKIRENHPELDEKILEIVRIYRSLVAGEKAHVERAVRDMVKCAVDGRPMSQLTNNPDEWEIHIVSSLPNAAEVWQSKRDPRMISMDRGHTFWDPVAQAPGERQVTDIVTDPIYDR